ncbi:MAG: hypothetical protein AAFR96_09120 [Planctomycetota bacterium]
MWWLGSWLTWQAVSLAAGLIGLVLVGIGFAGRRVGEGLHCARCGYDLAGTEQPDRCSECGRSLHQPRATRRGSHQRRAWALVAGVAMLVPASSLGWYISTVTQPVSTRPTWLMVGALALGSTSANQPAARELLSRWRAGRLGSLGRSTLSRWGVAAWADGHESRDWQHAEVIRFAFAQGEVSGQDIERVGRQLLRDVASTNDSRRRVLGIEVAGALSDALRPMLLTSIDDPAFGDAATLLLLDDHRSPPSGPLIASALRLLEERGSATDAGPTLDRLPLTPGATRAARFLTLHASTARPDLIRVLASPDPQQRLLAALILTEAIEPGDERLIGEAVASSLVDNDTPGDAVLASRAIVRAGPEAYLAARDALSSRAGARTRSSTEIWRLEELGDALIGERRIQNSQAEWSWSLPPHLERLARPLPWAPPPRPRWQGRPAT